jgi:hypothetical protein
MHTQGEKLNFDLKLMPEAKNNKVDYGLKCKTIKTFRKKNRRISLRPKKRRHDPDTLPKHSQKKNS